jgi:hypothetical protein
VNDAQGVRPLGVLMGVGEQLGRDEFGGGNGVAEPAGAQNGPQGRAADTR